MGGFQTKAPARPLSVLSDTLAKTNERKQMLSTATALIQATEESIFDDEAMGFAQFLTHEHNNLDNEQFAKAMFVYASMLASVAVDKATKVLLTETQIKELMSSIDEMETMRNEVLDGE